MKELKYIITKDLKHFKSDTLHHYEIAKANNYNPDSIIESGLFIDKQLFILESINQAHLLKHKTIYLGNVLNDREAEGKALNLLATQWLRGRELESQLYYSKRAVGLKEGD
jgi:hypothetical protein